MNLVILDGGTSKHKRHLLLDKVQYKDTDANELKDALELLIVRGNNSLSYTLDVQQIRTLHKYIEDNYIL